MSITRKIPRALLEEFDLHEGDLIHVVAVDDDTLEFVVSREDPVSGTGKAADWLESARGSVKLAEGESVDEARADFYATKYGISR